MTEKEKIKAEVERLKNDLIEAPNKSEIDLGRISAFEDMLLYIDSLPEEPVSEDLDAEILYLHERYPEVSFAKLTRIVVRATRWQKEQMMKDAVGGICTDGGLMGSIINTDIGIFYVKSGMFEVDDKLKIIIIKED